MSDKCPHEGQVTALDNDKRNINRSVATTDKNGNGDGRVAARTSLIHSVSIIVDSFNEDESRQGDDASRNLETTMTTNKCCDASKGRQSPIILLEEIDFERSEKSNDDEDIVKSIIANARLRKEEFARLLEEHAQLVSEINRVETSLL